MSRTQALTIGILAGGVVLVCAGLVAFLFLPFDFISPPPPTATLLPPTVTPSPTFPNFMPTTGLVTPSVEPTATNTRVPTVTPRLSGDPTPTVDFTLPTLAIRPTATPTAVDTPVILPSPTSLPTMTPLPILRYSISFEAEDSEIVEGDCTDLEWRTDGISEVELDGESVPTSGTKEVCPKEDRTYELSIEVPNSTRVERRNVTVSVEKEENED